MAQVAPRKRPRQARSKATVDAIITAAARVLVDKGYDGTSTNLVASGMVAVSVGEGEGEGEKGAGA
mgnify:CR=1 FL=1